MKNESVTPGRENNDLSEVPTEFSTGLYRNALAFSHSRMYRDWLELLCTETELSVQIKLKSSQNSHAQDVSEECNSQLSVEVQKKRNERDDDILPNKTSKRRTKYSYVVRKHPKNCFSNRWSFILAVIAALNGVEQVIRFPQAVGKNSGAFMLCYGLCLLLVALPIFRLELYLGQISKKCFVNGLGGLTPRGKGVALSAIFFALFKAWNTTKYCAASMLFFAESFSDRMPWIKQAELTCDALGTAQCSGETFCIWKEGRCGVFHGMQTAVYLEEMLNTQIFQEVPFADMGGFSLRMLLLIILIWVFVFLFAFPNLLALELLVSLSVILLAAVSFVVTVCFLASPEAQEAIKDVFTPSADDISDALSHFNVWISALDVSLGSLLCGTGVIPAVAVYAGSTNVVADSWWVTFFSASVSLMFCFIYVISARNLGIHTELGWLSETKRDSYFFYQVTQSWGFSFAPLYENIPPLYLYPEALSSLTSATVVSVLFFFVVALALLLSAVMITACVTETLWETKLFCDWKKYQIALLVCAVMCGASSVHAFGVGWSYSDFMDGVLRTIVYLIIIVAEVVCAGWLQGLDEQGDRLGSKGRRAVKIWLVSFLLAIITTPMIWRSHLMIPTHISRSACKFASLIVFLLLTVSGLFFALRNCSPNSSLRELKRNTHELIFGNVVPMRHTFTTFTKGYHPGDMFLNYLSPVWPTLIKYFLPAMCCFSIISSIGNFVQNSLDTKSPHFMSITPTSWVVAAVGFSLLILSPLIIGMIKPSLLNWSTEYPEDESWTFLTRRKARKSTAVNNTPSVRIFDGFRSSESLLKIPPYIASQSQRLFSVSSR